MDNQWRGRAIANRLKGGNDTKRRGLRLPNHSPQYTPPTRDPYAMNVDRLSVQEQANHMKKGLCFLCHLPGHRASDHGSGGSGPPPAPVMEQPFNNYFSFCYCLLLFGFVDDIIKGQQHESDFISFYLCLSLFGYLLSPIFYLLSLISLSSYLWLISYWRISGPYPIG